MSDGPAYDVVRVPGAAPAAAERAAEELAVLGAAGLRVALVAPAPLPPALRRAVEAGLADVPAPPVAARVALVDGVPADGALPAGVAAERVVDAAALPVVVHAPSWAVGRPATGDARAPVTGLLLPPGGALGTARALRASGVVAALAGLPVVLLVPPGSTAPLRAPAAWPVRALDAATGAAALTGVDVVVELGGRAGEPGREPGPGLARARALASGAPLLRLAGPGDPLRVVHEGDGEPVPVARLRERLLALDLPAASARARSAATSRHGAARWLEAGGLGAAAGRLPGAVAARPRVLFTSSNGAGMGHLTRLLAMARRASDDVEPLVASLSQAVAVAVPDAVPWQYVPSSGDLGIGTRRWNRLFARRWAQVLREVRPAAVVYDGTYPYLPLLASRDDVPGVRYVWSRRGMWRPGLGAAQLARSHVFDLVVEPGEVAAEVDRGATVGRGDAVRVRPVTLLDEADLLDRESACRELGLDPARPAALVTLGAGNLSDPRTVLGAVVQAALQVRDLQVCVTRPVISAGSRDLGSEVRSVSAYPLSRTTRAFDWSVGSGGYNSFHESVAFALPTAFLGAERQMDDQTARARWAADAGCGLHLERATVADVEALLPVLTDPATRDGIARRCREVWPGNGAQDAVRAVEALVAGAAPAELLGAGA
ncbi:hypothetical protein [Vallicoccus soli]|uniref:Glycosyl transferase family 28 C-terminal domain-containing protein n=1 Tax=Vallicoccus soli TaxID=2339232 RepID=A0A3A3ZIJ4_9ACTN|nr:hypothetical protein [Vallicoccus soli]RJK95336.1 hypothetical protein D5H78_11765 [Vallicoccus soli]